MFLLKVAGESEKRLEKRAGDLLVVRLTMAMKTVMGRKGPVSETVVLKGTSDTCLNFVVSNVSLVSFLIYGDVLREESAWRRGGTEDGGWRDSVKEDTDRTDRDREDRNVARRDRDRRDDRDNRGPPKDQDEGTEA